MRLRITILVLAAILSGCGAQHKPDDARITAAVRTKLSAAFGPIEARQDNQYERGADKQTISYIEVRSENGVVTLTGEVRSKRAKAQAEKIAREVESVTRVNNNLSVAPGYSDDAVEKH